MTDDAKDDLPWRRMDIDRGLILFRTSSNAHGSTNVSILSERVDALPQSAKDELAGMMRNIANGLSPAPAVAVPEGWKLIPIEPTDEMLRVGYANSKGSGNISGVYTAMLAAAPQPPATRSYEEGIEAAAMWHDEEARKANKVDWNGSAARSHARYATAIRSLADEPRHGE